jgi:hypothetical protein
MLATTADKSVGKDAGQHQAGSSPELWPVTFAGLFAGRLWLATAMTRGISGCALSSLANQAGSFRTRWPSRLKHR